MQHDYNISQVNTRSLHGNLCYLHLKVKEEVFDHPLYRLSLLNIYVPYRGCCFNFNQEFQEQARKYFQAFDNQCKTKDEVVDRVQYYQHSSNLHLKESEGVRAPCPEQDDSWLLQ